jgi:hypothetical protein
VKVAIFSGPTLTRAEIAAEIDAEIFPPASRGDILRVAEKRPRAIGIIDGYFDRMPSVWHKEILWAMRSGIWVFGAASMGALRAVEMAPFGMVGVGEIFRAFHSGELTDDDEVAVVHGSAEDGFRPLSEAMVNVRATLAAAGSNGVLSAQQIERLLAVAKGLYYPERSYPRIIEAARFETASSPVGLTEFEAWLPAGAVNQKRDDAIDLLRVLREFTVDDPPPMQLSERFEHTEAWDALLTRTLEEAQGDGKISGQDFFEEVQVSRDYPMLVDAALSRALSLRFIPHVGGRAEATATRAACDEFRRERELIEGERFERHLTSLDLDPGQVDQFFRDFAELRRIRLLFQNEIKTHLADCLREKGLYAIYARRIDDKRRALRTFHNESPTADDFGVAEGDFWDRFFRDVLGTDTPADIATFAHLRGFPDVKTFEVAAARELLWRTAKQIP